MNKKATLVHWIVFGVVAALGLFIILNIDTESGAASKGVWQMSYLRAFQDAEKDLLLIDQVTKEAAELVSNTLVQNTATDIGCGLHNGFTLWNNGDNFCQLTVSDEFKDAFNQLVKDKTKISYDEIVFSGKDVVGKNEEEKTITSSFELIPTEQRAAGLFTPYDSYLIEPFYLEYKYNPGFRVKDVPIVIEYDTIYLQAQTLVGECNNELNLRDCLDQQRETNWYYNSCTTEDYPLTGRVIPFCVLLNEREYNLALDFSSDLPFSAENVIAYYDAETITTSFDHDPSASSYRIYYTNWYSALNKIPPAQSAEDIFFDIPQVVDFGFYKVLELADLSLNCPDEKVLNQAYLCEDQIIYLFKDPQLTAGDEFLFAVTIVSDGQESLIDEFVEVLI